MTEQEQKAFDQMREALESSAVCIQLMSDGPSRANWGGTLDIIDAALTAANAVSHPQATEPTEKRKLYECTGCGHLYLERTSSCECMENSANTYNDWVATPAAPEAHHGK